MTSQAVHSVAVKAVSLMDFISHETTSAVQLLITGRAVRGSNPGGGEIFRASPDRPWGPPSLLYNGYRVLPGGKAAGALTTHSPSNVGVKERVEVYLSSAFVFLWHVADSPF
jgi:hypothetical protein